MISMKDAGNDYDRSAAGRCLLLWQETLRSVGVPVFPLSPEAARRAEEDLNQLRHCVEGGAPDEALDSAPRLVERVFLDYAQESRRVQREELESVKSILRFMADAVGAARLRTNSHNDSLRGACQSLELLAENADLAELRRKLAGESQKLRASVAEMRRENESMLCAMETELNEFRTKLAAAESAAATDRVTGLANRREMERQIDLRIQRFTPFCALLLGLDDFKSVNSRYGHECGDQALRTFAAMLSQQMRPGDVLARWGGDEFLALLDCAIPDGIRRAAQISAAVARKYDLVCNGATIPVILRASAGVVEYRAEESAIEFLRRAGVAMSAVKAGQQSPSPAG